MCSVFILINSSYRQNISRSLVLFLSQRTCLRFAVCRKRQTKVSIITKIAYAEYDYGQTITVETCLVSTSKLPMLRVNNESSNRSYVDGASQNGVMTNNLPPCYVSIV